MKLRTWALASPLLLLPVTAGAQATGTGTVIGRVTDSSAAVLPGVTVTLKSAEAMGHYTAVTDAQGAYRVVNLPPASYEARAELQGFQTAVQRVMVRVATTLSVDFSLSVGAMTETVTVRSPHGSSAAGAPDRTGRRTSRSAAGFVSGSGSGRARRSAAPAECGTGVSLLLS